MYESKYREQVKVMWCAFSQSEVEEGSNLRYCPLSAECLQHAVHWWGRIHFKAWYVMLDELSGMASVGGMRLFAACAGVGYKALAFNKMHPLVTGVNMRERGACRGGGRTGSAEAQDDEAQQSETCSI